MRMAENASLFYWFEALSALRAFLNRSNHAFSIAAWCYKERRVSTSLAAVDPSTKYTLYFYRRKVTKIQKKLKYSIAGAEKTSLNEQKDNI